MNDTAQGIARSSRPAPQELQALPPHWHELQAEAASATHREGPPRFTLRRGAIACAGVFLVIAVLAFSSFNLGVLLALGSFGSSAVMVFTFPKIHFSQPRSVVVRHFICTAVGLAALASKGRECSADRLDAPANSALGISPCSSQGELRAS